MIVAATKAIARGAFLTFATAGALMANGPETGMETIRGVLLGPGVECMQFRLDDGEQISLTGPVPEAAPGTALTLTGRWAMVSYCMQGRTFSIEGGEVRQ